MTETYAYLIHEPDWDSDAFLDAAAGAGSGPAGKDPGAPGAASSGEAPATGGTFPEHQAFQKAVAELGARIVGGAALQNQRHGGVVTPGSGDRLVEDAVYTDGPFPDTSEVITGFYLVEADDEDTARRIAALVPTGGHIEWRKVFPTGM
ncbi:MAG TPA: YciI family protein [Terrabacter sp.]|nr:YciI family protein [Terrabacter sp.]